MNILGMGTLEVLVILLVAFVLLGPQRMVDAARLLGKASREARRLVDSLPDLTLEDDEPNSMQKPVVHRGGGPNPTVGGPAEDASGRDKESAGTPDDNAPVKFEPAGSSISSDSDDGKQPQKREAQ